MSLLIIRPLSPEPATAARSIPDSLAMALAKGDALILSSSDTDSFDTKAGEAGCSAGAAGVATSDFVAAGSFELSRSPFQSSPSSPITAITPLMGTVPS